jgi:enoyl-CoA hydratase
MTGRIELSQAGAVARLRICHPARFNAMSRQMWRELQDAFLQLQANRAVRCVVISGEGDHFCAGGDISEYTEFRFQEASLRHFHEVEVWGALQAMLDCDVPLVAEISGNCMGAGMEIASCCDIRLAAEGARFGAPIARLGFPMAPREAALVAREAGLTVVRQMLLEAAVFNASDLKAAGFLSRMLPDAQLTAEASATALRISALAPQAARLNKQTIRALNSSLGLVSIEEAAIKNKASSTFDAGAYAYADSPEHREGIAAFLDKRKPQF